MNDEVVIASGVRKAYGGVVALDEVDLVLRPGLCALLGPNGAGKTTLLRILATVLAPDAGRVLVGGHDAGRRLRAVRSLLGYVPQEPALYPHFTVWAFLDYVALLHGIKNGDARRRALERAVDLADLGPLAGRRIRTLSGGTRRRVAIAAGVVGEPLLLLMDEPFAGLDPEQRVQLRQVVRRLAGEAAVLVSTHQTDDVELAFDRVLVLDHGRFWFDGTPQDLAGRAAGRVWFGPGTDEDRSVASWATAEPGRFRHVGDPPAGRELAPPSIEDAYLLLLGEHRATAKRVS